MIAMVFLDIARGVYYAVNEIFVQEFWETDASFGIWLEISLHGPVRWDVFGSSKDVSKEPPPCHGDVESQRLALRPPV